MNNKAIYSILIALILGLVAISYIETKKINRLNNKLSLSISNEKAYMYERDSLQNTNRMFQLTVDQLNSSKDSIVTKLNQSRKELNIKNKNIKSLEYLVSEGNKIDTIEFRDTIFKEPKLKVDTILGDKWYKCNLGLEYPNKIIINPIFNSEKHIITYYKKEYIKPRKKWWIQRIFQRRHKVIEVNVVEKNPYIKNKQSKFINVIK